MENGTRWWRITARSFPLKLASSSQLAGNLSGGNQQKVVLSKWLCQPPESHYSDEPTRGIDVAAKAEIYAIIDELAAAGACIIMVSSEPGDHQHVQPVLCHVREGSPGELSEQEFSQEAMMSLATKR